MKIKSFSVNSATASTVEIIPTKPICFLRGRGADALLDLMRKTLGDLLPHTHLCILNDCTFVLHTEVELDCNDYRICFIHNAENGKDRIIVNYSENSLAYSRDDTREYLQKCAVMNETASNVLVGSASVEDNQDQRPIFVYDYFDRLDESVDILPMLDELASYGRQVFIAVCSGYHDVHHPSVQMCSVDLH